LRSRILVFSVGMRLMALKLFRRHELPQNSSLNLFSSEEIFRIASQRSKVFTIMPKVPAVYVRDLRNECLQLAARNYYDLARFLLRTAVSLPLTIL
jgi:hypothetical protein